MTKLTKAEREELPARIEAAIATVCSGMAAMSIPANPRDVDLVLADCAKALADLDAAERLDDVRREQLASQQKALSDHMNLAWIALGKPDGTYDTTNVQRLCEQFAAVKADLDAAEAERDEAVALIDAAKSDVRPESFLEHAQAILAKCIAPYSCEQMKAVGDALAGCYRKWELMSEVALKAKEDADSMTKCKGCGGTVGDHLAPDQGGCPGSFEIDGVQMVPLAGRDNAVAQRDRAESERDSERKLRVEAEAAATRAEAESATFSRRLAEALVRNDEDDLGCDRARMEEMRDERDALKAKLADPRRVLIHETEVVATKEEIASLKARLADLSEADEELHTCRALVNATSENLSVDLERMVDDLAEANEKAARSEKDSHSWHELYKDTKAKLAAAESAHSELFLSGQVAELRGKLAALVEAAVAAARGGAS